MRKHAWRINLHDAHTSGHTLGTWHSGRLQVGTQKGKDVALRLCKPSRAGGYRQVHIGMRNQPLQAVGNEVVKVLDGILCIALDFIHSLEDGCRQVGCEQVQERRICIKLHGKGHR